MSLFITESLEKTAAINVKNDFNSNSIQERIITEVHKAVPLIKDLKYGLVIKNKDTLSGDLYGVLQIQAPSKKYKDVQTRISIPIFIKDYQMAPIDTILINNAAFPVGDNIVKEILQDPEMFRILKPKEISESKILSKLAEIDSGNLSNELSGFIEKTASDVMKLFAIVQKKGLEAYELAKEKNEEFTEPIFECFLEKNASNDFDLHYIKRNHEGNLEFLQEEIDPASAKMLLDTIGYNLKVAEKATQPGGVLLKSAIAYPKGESIPIDLKKVDKVRLVDSLKTGPVEVMLANGSKIEGLLYDIATFSSGSNIYPEGKLFIDYKKNYAISSNFQGTPSKKDLVLLPDDETASGSSQGVYVDPEKNIAYGPIEIENWVSSPNSIDDSYLNVKYKGRKFKIKKLPGIVRNIVQGNEITIPTHYTWHKIKNEIKIVDNVDDIVLNKIAETTHKVTFESPTKGFIVTPIKNSMSKVASIPTKKHLMLFFERVNLLSDDFNKVANNIMNGTALTFTTDYAMDDLYVKKTLNKVASTSLSPIQELEPVVNKIKEAHSKTTSFFEKFFDLTRDESFLESLDLTAENLLDYDENAAPIKTAGAFETLDTIFSLNLINNANSAVFLSSIDKLKSTVSTLAALRVYLRIGWNVSIDENDVNQAIDGLVEVIKALELIKSQKYLNLNNV